MATSPPTRPAFARFPLAPESGRVPGYDGGFDRATVERAEALLGQHSAGLQRALGSSPGSSSRCRCRTLGAASIAATATRSTAAAIQSVRAIPDPGRHHPGEGDSDRLAQQGAEPVIGADPGQGAGGTCCCSVVSQSALNIICRSPRPGRRGGTSQGGAPSTIIARRPGAPRWCRDAAGGAVRGVARAARPRRRRRRSSRISPQAPAPPSWALEIAAPARSTLPPIMFPSDAMITISQTQLRELKSRQPSSRSRPNDCGGRLRARGRCRRAR